MSGFDDLIPAAMPYLASEHITATAGSSWQWDYIIVDDTGAPVDLSSGYTFAAAIAPQGGGTAVYTPAVTSPATGVLRCTVPAATTASDAGNVYLHAVTITRTSDSAKVVVVGGGGGKFAVKKKVF